LGLGESPYAADPVEEQPTCGEIAFEVDDNTTAEISLGELTDLVTSDHETREAIPQPLDVYKAAALSDEVAGTINVICGDGRSGVVSRRCRRHLAHASSERGRSDEIQSERRLA